MSIHDKSPTIGEVEETNMSRPISDKQLSPRSENADLAKTLADINENMGHMSEILGAMWSHSQTGNAQGSTRKRKHDVEPSCSDDSSESEIGDGKRRRSSSKETNDEDKISIHAEDDDDISVLLASTSKGKKKAVDGSDNTTDQTDETLRSLATVFEDVEATSDDIQPQLADIATKRWNQKLVDEKLKMIHAKYRRPANCPTVCSTRVNPEIWAQLGHSQKRADLSVASLQENVRKVAVITLQTANSLIKMKSNADNADIKQLLTQSVDAIALLGHVSHELAYLRRGKIKSVLKPEYSSICMDDGQHSKYLFGDDLPKRLRDAKETSKVGQVVNTSQPKNSSNRFHQNSSKTYDRRNWRQNGQNYNNRFKKDFFGKGKPHQFRRKPTNQEAFNKK